MRPQMRQEQASPAAAVSAILLLLLLLRIPPYGAHSGEEFGSIRKNSRRSVVLKHETDPIDCARA